jgi:hypothetical protein
MIESIKKLDLFLFKLIHVRMSNEVFHAILTNPLLLGSGLSFFIDLDVEE